MKSIGLVAEEEETGHRNRSIGICLATVFGDGPDHILLPISARTPTEASSDWGIDAYIHTYIHLNILCLLLE